MDYDVTTDWIDQFLECCSTADRRQLRIEQAFLIKHANQPSSVFKFRGVTEYALQNLTDDTVWLNSPSKYNDPFDCAATLSSSELTKQGFKDAGASIPDGEIIALIGQDSFDEALAAENPMREITRRALSVDPQIDQSQIPKIVDAFERAFLKINGGYLASTLDKIRESLKVCSFCATKDLILMWSHYADYHKGFCIEYAVADLHDMARRMLFPVIYREKMFDSTPYHAAAMQDRASFNNLYPMLQALHKAPAWAYEQEWRLVFPAGVIPKEMSYSFGPSKAVYLGARISDEDRGRVVDICRQKGVPVFQMSLASDEFRLTSAPLEV